MGNRRIIVQEELLSWTSEMTQMFLTLLFAVNTEPTTFKGEPVGAGSVATTVSKLSMRLDLSPRSVRTVLSKLEKIGAISISANSKFTEISVNGFEKYLFDDEKVREQSDKPTTNDLSVVSNCSSNNYNGLQNHKCEQTDKPTTNGQKVREQSDKPTTNDLYIPFNYESGVYEGLQDNKCEQTDKPTTNGQIQQKDERNTTKEENPSALPLEERNTKKEENDKKEKQKQVFVWEKKDETQKKPTRREMEEALAKRSEDFYNTLVPYLGKYTPEMLRMFYDYWSQPNKTKSKMRFEGEDYWDLAKRLAYWSRRNDNK